MRAARSRAAGCAVCVYHPASARSQCAGERRDAGRSRRAARDARGSMDGDRPGSRADGRTTGSGSITMNRKAEYFERYEALAAVSGRMLGAARSADWSALPELQAEFMQLVDGLREADPGVVLDESDLGRKLDLIRRIRRRRRDSRSRGGSRAAVRAVRGAALDQGIDRSLPRARVGPVSGEMGRARVRWAGAQFPRTAPACRARIRNDVAEMSRLRS